MPQPTARKRKLPRVAGPGLIESDHGNDAEAKKGRTANTDDEAPGTPGKSHTFITVKDDELKLAGYLGFANTSEVRQLVFTWPVMKAFLAFHPLSKQLQKGGIFRMINNAEATIFQADPDKQWPKNEQLENTDTEDTHAAHLADRQLHSAWILLHLENDFKVYDSNEESTNKDLTEKCLPLLAQYLDRKLPSRFPGSPVPSLGPLTGEHRLESINRCWNLLRWICHLHTRGPWGKRLGNEEAVQDGQCVKPSDLPKWMQPSEEN